MADSERLLSAAREGQAAEVRRLIAEGANPNVRFKVAEDHGAFFEEVTPLMVAAGSPRSNAETVSALLEGGADPFAVSAGEVTALWYAAGGGTGYPDTSDLEEGHPYKDWGGGDAERLRIFLDAGLPASEAADNGRTAVGEACSVGDAERLALLLERGGSVWPVQVKPFDYDSIPEFKHVAKLLGDSLKPDKSGFEARMVPLFIAAESGSLECVKLILRHGFPVDFECSGENALNYASSVEIAELFLEAGLVPRTGSFGFDAIDEAFDNGRNAVAMAMILRVKDPAKKQEILNSKLISCSGVRMNPEALRLLIAAGAEVNRVDRDYGSPLHYAAWQGDGNGGRENETVEAVLRILLAAGADPNLRARGSTPLHEAAEGDWGSPTSIRVLLEHGAKVNALNDSKETPLMLAAGRGDLECVKVLLAAGADPSLALRNAKQNLKTWKSLAAQKPKRIFKFLEKFGLDAFGSVEETQSSYQKAAEDAAEILALVEGAHRTRQPSSGP